MINTSTGQQHALWDQIVRKETVAKQRFEYLTGETQAKKFFNGMNSMNVDNKLDTYDKFRASKGLHPHRGAQSATRTLNVKRSSQANLDRYSTASKADALSRALEEVIERRSKKASSSVSRSVVPQPFVNSTLNAKTVRDVDSQADRYRNTIRELEKLQAQCTTNPSGVQTVKHIPGKVFPTPVREGVFDRNKKSDGVKYADAKTRARKFELDRISQAYNPNRLVHVTAKDAMIDPHVTIRHEQALPKKDPGYKAFAQQDLHTRDKVRRVITDYTGTPIVKVDQEGGIFDQQLGQGIFKTLSPQLDKQSSRSVRARLGAKTNNLTAYGDLTGQGAGRDKLSSSFLNVQNALQQSSRPGMGARDACDVDSTLSTRGLMQRKLYLMKMMLKNERHANSLMKQRIGEIDREIHENNPTMRKLEEQLAQRK